jgi:hypothetical protein
LENTIAPNLSHVWLCQQIIIVLLNTIAPNLSHVWLCQQIIIVLLNTIAPFLSLVWLCQQVSSFFDTYTSQLKNELAFVSSSAPFWRTLLFQN